MDKAGKITASILTVIIVMSSLALPLAKPVSAQPTPNQLFTPSTVAPLQYYSVPPLSSINLKVCLPSFGGMLKCGCLIYVKGGSGNDINLRVIDPQGKTVLDLGRISSQKEFYITPYETGNYTIIIDNEFSLFSFKEVSVSSSTSPVEFAGLSINFWVILLLIILSFVVLVTFVVWLRKRRKYNLIGKHRKTKSLF